MQVASLKTRSQILSRHLHSSITTSLMPLFLWQWKECSVFRGWTSILTWRFSVWRAPKCCHRIFSTSLMPLFLFLTRPPLQKSPYYCHRHISDITIIIMNSISIQACQVNILMRGVFSLGGAMVRSVSTDQDGKMVTLATYQPTDRMTNVTRLDIFEQKDLNIADCLIKWFR